MRTRCGQRSWGEVAGWGVGQSSNYIAGSGGKDFWKRSVCVELPNESPRETAFSYNSSVARWPEGNACVGNFTPSDGSSIKIYFQKEIP